MYIWIKFCIDCCFEELKETKPEIEEEETKKQKTKQQLKVAKIALLKKDYEHGTIDVMDYLIKLSEFIKHYDD